MLKSERGQALIIIAMGFAGFLTMIALAAEGGNLFAARARLLRATDAAALAGALKLPDCCASTTTAYTYALDYLQANEAEAQIQSMSSPNSGQVALTAYRDVPALFFSILGFSNVRLTASATAGFGAVDICLALDDTGSMSASEITSLKTGVTSFTYSMNMPSDVPLPPQVPSVLMGLVPFGYAVIETIAEVTHLTADRESLLTGADELGRKNPPYTTNIGAGHYAGTSIGSGIKRCHQELFDPLYARPTGTVEKVMVLFTDGQNSATSTGEFCQSPNACSLWLPPNRRPAMPVYAGARVAGTPPPAQTPGPAASSTPTPWEVLGQPCGPGQPCVGHNTNTPTRTRTPTPPPANTSTPTRTNTPAATATPAGTATPAPTATPTWTPTITSTSTIAPTATRTSTPNPLWTATATRTATPNPPSATPTYALTPTPRTCTSSCYDQETRRYAQIAKNAGVTIYTIGYGASQCLTEAQTGCSIDAWLLKEVASGSDRYYYAATEAVIGEAFAAIGQRIGHRLLR